jgi:branched-chain amino acid transport system permease protein
MHDAMTKYGIIAALAVALAIPFLTDSMFILNLLVLMLIFIIFASAWNLLAYSGQGSLGHAAFFGIGAYASTLIAAKSGMSPFITIFLGAAVAAVIGILIGLTCVRLKEWFLAMVTFGFAIIVQTLTVSILAPVTGGWDGIASARLLSPSIPGYQLIEYYAILTITIASIAAIWYIMKSRVGLAFLAIRENELEARAAGIDPVRYRLLAFALSAPRSCTGSKTHSGRSPMSFSAGSVRSPAPLSERSCLPSSGRGSKQPELRSGDTSSSGSSLSSRSYSSPGVL